MTHADELPGLGDVIPCACGCGERLKEMDERKRPRLYMKGHQLRAALARFRAPAVPANT